MEQVTLSKIETKRAQLEAISPILQDVDIRINWVHTWMDDLNKNIAEALNQDPADNNEYRLKQLAEYQVQLEQLSALKALIEKLI